MTANGPSEIGKAASSTDDPERGAAADAPDPEYTVNDIYFLLFAFPASFFVTFGLAPFIDVPNWGAPPSADTWADPRSVGPFSYLVRIDSTPGKQCDSSKTDFMQKLNFIVQYGAVIALVVRLFRFCWLHRGDVYVWSVSNLGGFLSAHALRLVLRPAFPAEFPLEASTFVPWTYVGSLLAYVVYRLREPERLLKR